MVKGFSDMSAAEIEQVHRWTQAGMTPNAIAELQGRDPGTVTKFLPPDADGNKPQSTPALNPDCRARLIKINKSQKFARTRLAIKRNFIEEKKERKLTKSNVSKKKMEHKKDNHAVGKKRGRPPMTPADYAKCERSLMRLQKRAKGEEEVTAAMVLQDAKVAYSEGCLRKHFALHGKPFRKLREKPLLTPDDVQKRWRFVKKHGRKSKRSWRRIPHAIIDNKRYQMFLDAKGRNYIARRSCRGAYRDGKDAVRPDLVKPKKTLKCSVSGVLIAAAVVKDRIRMWHVVEGRWTGAKAAQMYEGPLLQCLEKAYPTHAKKVCGKKKRGKWSVLEDNDPTGYKSTMGKDAKKKVGIGVFELPPRSPDLNVLDYSLWAAINKRLREQERNFPKNKKELKVEFIARLRKTALGLPPSVVRAAVEDMQKKCKLINEAEGGLIDE